MHNENLKPHSRHQARWRAFQSVAAALLLAAGTQAAASVTNPVIGQLLWSEEFNGTSLNTGIWSASDGNGCQINLCGYGNAELQYYSPNNLSIVNVPFESGTRALAIQARKERTAANAFTSGKIDTKGKVQVQYGMVEVRMSTPAVETGLWPAAWMLGVSAETWPRNGEIDIMEMGHKASVRASAGSPSANNFVGSNVITYHEAACVPGNESCAASTAWQTKNWYVSSTPLVNRFVTYRLYWDESQMRFTVIDNGIERDMYDAPLAVNSASLQAPFYLLLNLAVGGNFTDAATVRDVTAPLPGTMYVDYVRVYQLDGKGQVKLGNQNTAAIASVTQASATTVRFNAKAGSWADVHYTVNNGVRQNVRMRLDGSTNTYVAGGLKIGDVVRYSITYWDTARNYAVDTAWQSHTMK